VTYAYNRIMNIVRRSWEALSVNIVLCLPVLSSLDLARLSRGSLYLFD